MIADTITHIKINVDELSKSASTDLLLDKKILDPKPNPSMKIT